MYPPLHHDTQRIRGTQLGVRGACLYDTGVSPWMGSDRSTPQWVGAGGSQRGEVGKAGAWDLALRLWRGCHLGFWLLMGHC